MLGLGLELSDKEDTHFAEKNSKARAMDKGVNHQVGKVRVEVGGSFESTCIWRSRMGQGNGYDASIRVSLGW